MVKLVRGPALVRVRLVRGVVDQCHFYARIHPLYMKHYVGCNRGHKVVPDRHQACTRRSVHSPMPTGGLVQQDLGQVTINLVSKKEINDQCMCMYSTVIAIEGPGESGSE